MILKIRYFITITIIIQLIGYTQDVCSTVYIYHELYQHKYVTNDIYLYPKKILSLCNNNNHKKFPPNYIHNLNNFIITCPYSNQSLLSWWNQNISKIRIQNDCIHISYTFYNYQNNYQKILPFIQLGFQKKFSEKIFSIGGGNRYAYNHLYAYGYNIFYHFPIFTTLDTMHNINIQQPPYINISGEYWYHNTLLMLNSFHKINNLINIKKNLSDNKNYPYSGYQIHMQNQFFKFLKFTGKMTLEYFFYHKLNNNENYSINNNNCNYRLIYGINYHPIPILSINIDKTFTNSKKYNNLTCQICIDYQFNVPITQQIYCFNDKKYPSIFLHLNEIISPFFPVPPDLNNSNNYNIKSNIVENSYTEEITGYPGEIKLININIAADITNNKTCNNRYNIQWNIQSLQTLYKYGGNITLLHEKNNVYVIHMPIQPMTKEQQLIISYVITDHDHDNTKNSNDTNIVKNILISVKNFQQKSTKIDFNNPAVDPVNTNVAINSENLTALDINIVNKKFHINGTPVEYKDLDHVVNHEIIPSSILTDLKHPIVYREPSANKDINTQSSVKSNVKDNDMLPYHLQSQPNTSSFDNNIIQDDKSKKIVISPSSYHATILPPPPLPLSLLMPEENLRKSVSSQSPCLKNNDYSSDPAVHQKNTNYHKNVQIKLPVAPESTQQAYDMKKCENINTDNNISKNADTTLQENLSYLLSTHKKHKFSSIGTIEHIKKLENFTINKKLKNISEMEKIFNKLHLTQSTSSIDEPCYTTEDDESD